MPKGRPTGWQYKCLWLWSPRLARVHMHSQRQQLLTGAVCASWRSLPGGMKSYLFPVWGFATLQRISSFNSRLYLRYDMHSGWCFHVHHPAVIHGQWVPKRVSISQSDSVQYPSKRSGYAASCRLDLLGTSHCISSPLFIDWSPTLWVEMSREEEEEEAYGSIIKFIWGVTWGPQQSPAPVYRCILGKSEWSCLFILMWATKIPIKVGFVLILC